jgi:hypothetical protein
MNAYRHDVRFAPESGQSCRGQGGAGPRDSRRWRYLADTCGFKTKSKSAPHIASIATMSAIMMTLCLDIQSTDKPDHNTPATSPTTAMTQITDVTATTASMLFSFHMHAR